MTVLIQIRKASKSYGDQVLLDEAEATIHDGVKVGFVGRNGAGKSTLLKVILGEEELDAGEVVLHPHLRLGYLRQHDPFLQGESAMDFLMRDSGKPEWKCGEVAGRFELKGDYLFGPVANLSGGWQTRVKLAALLLHDPTLLLLDEPTNFLDLRTQILLEHFLRDFPRACLIVSHDRSFLGATCSQTLDITRGKLTMYSGKIDKFIEHQEERREHDRRVNATVMAKQKQLQRFIDKNRAGANTASQARSKAKQLERLKLTEIEQEEATARIRAPIVKPKQGTVVRTIDLEIGYPDLSVAKDIALEIERGERVAIVGDNGQGKTTLLRSLVDSLEPRNGVVRWGQDVEIGTYAQHVYTSLPNDQTILEYLEYQSEAGTTLQDLLAQAGALLFRDSHVHKKIKVLSGGERARVCLAGLLLGSYNVLVLDEPGNHLDVETVDALADALIAYQGTVLFTSHDRHFMKRVATSVVEVRDQRVRNYMGDYDSYLYSINKEIEANELVLRGGSSREAASGGDGEKNRKEQRAEAKQVEKDRRKLRKQSNKLESTIASLDERKKKLEAELYHAGDPNDAMKLHYELTEVSEELATAEEKWCELQAELGDE